MKITLTHNSEFSAKPAINAQALADMKRQKDVDNRIAMERRIIKKLMTKAVEAGFGVSVYDGEATACKCTTDISKAMQAIQSTDEDVINICLVDGQGNPLKTEEGRTKRFAMVHCVYGNDGYDVMSDYSSKLSELPWFLEVEAYATKQELQA